MISISYNYSTNDFEFLEKNIKEARLVSDDIHLTYVNKFFNGDEENEKLLKETHKICKGKCKLAEIQYDDNLKNLYSNKSDLYRYYHNYTRFVNYNKSKYNYIIFLDGDETIDGVLLKKWLNNFDIYKYNSYNMDCYWYFRSKKYQSTTYEGNPVIVNKHYLNKELIMNRYERLGLLVSPTISKVKFEDITPMIHHYSWAKGDNDEECKQKLLLKVKAWGHTEDKNWNNLIEEEFSRPFNGTDFIHGYNYKIL
jgi:hypothetical protein